MLNICAVIYKQKKEDAWKRGVAIISSPGLSDVITLIDAEGQPVVASDGGSCQIWDYNLLPAIGAISIPVNISSLGE